MCVSIFTYTRPQKKNKGITHKNNNIKGGKNTFIFHYIFFIKRQ